MLRINPPITNVTIDTVRHEANPLTTDAYERPQGLRQVVYDSDDAQEGLVAFH